MKSDISSSLLIPFLGDIYNYMTLSNSAPVRMHLMYFAHIILACNSIVLDVMSVTSHGGHWGHWPTLPLVWAIGIMCPPLGITFTAILFNSELPAPPPPLILDKEISQSKTQLIFFKRLLVFVVPPYTSSTLTSHPPPFWFHYSLLCLNITVHCIPSFESVPPHPWPPPHYLTSKAIPNETHV